MARNRSVSRRVRRAAPILALTLLAAPAWAQGESEAPAEPAAPSGFSAWNVQALWGNQFQEPFVPQDVSKGIITFENAAGWSWGSSFFFVDIVASDHHDGHATEVYSEWYPSLSLAKINGRKDGFGPFRDISPTLGINAGTKTNGAHPLVFLPGVTWDLKVPHFNYVSIGTYVYIERGKFDGEPNGCNATTYQVTPSWSLPFNMGGAKFSFDGFVDFIGDHGECSSQVLSQTQLKYDLTSFSDTPGKLYAGIEWQYWHNKFGIDGLDESFPQVMVQWKF